MRLKRRWSVCAGLVGLVLLSACSMDVAESEYACVKMLINKDIRRVGKTREQRFLGKVPETTAGCLGGKYAVAHREGPWLDWPNYWAAGDASTKAPLYLLADAKFLGPNGHGINGALYELELQRIELIKFNLFDNNKTYEAYVAGRGGEAGPLLDIWPEMRLPSDHPQYKAVGGDQRQACRGELIRFRTVTGICNDIHNPLMGSTHQLFARNAQFDTTFPDMGRNELTRNRHGDRLGLLKPDPQTISRKLLTRQQTQPEKCRNGSGVGGEGIEAHCDYKKAPFFNVLAAFWIQFMTHDWVSHLEEGHNHRDWMNVGCDTHLVGGVDKPLTDAETAGLGCRPGDRIDKAYVAEGSEPPSFTHDGKTYPTRAPKTTRNNVTAWWDASQLYGYDEVSRRRVKRDPNDPARLLLVSGSAGAGAGEAQGYLPTFAPGDPINPEWTGQEATAFPDNWSIGLSFYHNVFAREHNVFVETFRRQSAQTPDADSGLRNPVSPTQVIRYKDVTPDVLFEVARLVISAEIAKIHTIEWTTQLLYGEPLYRGMNANWHGVFHKQ